jgi:hypothetical protein
VKTREQGRAFRATWSQAGNHMNDGGVTVTYQELAILCDIVGGKNKRWDANLIEDQKQALDHLIANGFVKPTDRHPFVKYKPTGKTEMLFTQLCTGVSGGYS